ncbi:MAG: hypothetical protein H0V17_08160 [Deltaproteobacteria bacterium]|nr:hypothetical protein [Deltaproteobacteria bacterium]
MRWLAAYGCVIGGCFSPAPPIGLPCGDGLSCPAGQTCDIISNECGLESEASILRDDTAADFAMAGADTSQVAIESQGFVGPIPYVTGAVRLSGYDGLLLPDLGAASFDAIIANPKTGTTFARSSRILFGASNPPGLGIADPDNATITIEGEIDLDAIGAWRFQLTANDRGFFEIARPGSDAFERIVEDVDTGTSSTFVSDATGWHKFRAAFQDAASFFDFELLYDPPNVSGNGLREVPSDFLRAPATDVSGLLVDGFEHANLLFHRGAIVSGDPLTDVTLPMDPLGLPVGIGAFSLRWSGQVLVDDDGDYTFALDTFGGHRLWIDGVLVADAFSFAAAQSTTEPVTLRAGWHDVVLDLNKDGGTTGRLAFSVTSGQFPNGVIPADHLRPVPGRVARFLSDRNTTALAIPDGNGTSAVRSLTLDLPASLATTQEIRGGIDVEAANLATISLVINPPAGANVVVADFGSMSGTGTRFHHVLLAPSNLGTFWQFLGTDNLLDLQTGSILSVHLTVVYDGSIAPFATAYRYESAVRELGDAVAFERIAWTTRQAADDAAVVVKLRTCDTEEACAEEPYTAVENTGVPGVEPRRFVQYAVEMTSSGDVPTALDAIELRYFVRGAPGQ